MIDFGIEFISRFVGWIGFGLVEVFNKFIEFCGYVLSSVLGILPTSPFLGAEKFIADNEFLNNLQKVL